MIDEKLNLYTHDMEYSNYDEQLISDQDQVLQNIKIRLLMFKGEFFLNENLGTINMDDLRSKRNIKNLIDASIKTTIVDTPEVTSIQSYSSSVSPTDRTMSITFVVNTVYGTSQTQNVGIVI